MITYMYTTTYTYDPDFPINKNKKVPTLRRLLASAGDVSTCVFEPACGATDARMYAMGDKYDVSGLKETALESYREGCEREDLDSLLECLVGSIPVIFTTTPETDRGLRWAAIGVAAKQFSKLKRLPAFGELFQENADFAWAVAIRMDLNTALWCHNCHEYRYKKKEDVECGLHHVCGGDNCDTWLLANFKCPRCVQKGRHGDMDLKGPQAADSDW